MSQEEIKQLRYARELHKRVCVEVVQRNVTHSTTMPRMDIADRMMLQDGVNRISELNREINQATLYDHARKRLDETRDAMLLRRQFTKEAEVKTKALQRLVKKEAKSNRLARRLDLISDLHTEAEDDLMSAVDVLVAPRSESYSHALFDQDVGYVTQDVRGIYDDIVDSALGCQSSDLTNALIRMRAQDGELKDVPVCDTRRLPDVPNALPQ